MTRKTTETAERMAEKAKNWFVSEKGQNELREIFKRTEEAKTELAEASRVDLNSLNKPVTL